MHLRCVYTDRKMYGQLFDAVKREDEGAVRDLLKKASAYEVNYQDEVSLYLYGKYFLMRTSPFASHANEVSITLIIQIKGWA